MDARLVVLVMIVLPVTVAWRGPAVGLLALLITAAALTVWQAAGAWLFLICVPALALVGLPWPAPALLPAVLWFVLHGRGVVGRRTWPSWPYWTAAVVSVLAAACLASRQLALELPLIDIQRPSTTALVAVIVVAAVVNASAEELLWRGLVMDGLLGAGWRAGTAVGASALSFGLAHWHGLPGGWPGLAGATVLGLVLGRLRLRHGLLAALVLHLFVDMAIYTSFAAHAVFLLPVPEA